MMEMVEKDLFIEKGKAVKGSNPKEVVIAVSPAFGTRLKETIKGMPLRTLLKEVCAGIEEEGMTPRLIKVYGSSDLAIIASIGSKLSGSGISIGLQSRGTAVIHQKDLVPLDNLELLPQCPLYEKENYRALGKNAAKYVSSSHPEPVEALNDFMVPSKFLVRSTLLHFREVALVDKEKSPVELELV